MLANDFFKTSFCGLSLYISIYNDSHPWCRPWHHVRRQVVPDMKENSAKDSVSGSAVPPESTTSGHPAPWSFGGHCGPILHQMGWLVVHNSCSIPKNVVMILIEYKISVPEAWNRNRQCFFFFFPGHDFNCLVPTSSPRLLWGSPLWRYQLVTSKEKCIIR